MNKILFLVANGFEDVELFMPLDILMRGGVLVTLASIDDNTTVESARHVSIQTNQKLSELNLNEFSGIFLPGGGLGVENLKSSEKVLETVRYFYENKKWVTAICAAPLVLAHAGVIKSHKITSYPSVESDLLNDCKTYSKERVVTDSNIITSQGPGSAEEFGFKFLELLEGNPIAEKVKAQMICR